VSHGRLLDLWKSSVLGGDLVMHLRTNAEVAQIRVREMVPGRPRLDTLVAPLLAAAPAAVVDGPSEIVTDEGELGVLITVADDRRQTTAAFVFGDESYAHIEGVARSPASFAATRATVIELAQRHSLGLGTDRWRRFPYAPPPGWTGVARPRETLWISPACPRRHQLIRVYDARPANPGSGALGRELVERTGFTAPPRSRRRFRTRAGLNAELVTYACEGGQVISETTVTDDRYRYRFRLECDEDSFGEASPVFAALVVSLRPLRLRRIETDVFAAWQD
jgi:hypothetical protein